MTLPRPTTSLLALSLLVAAIAAAPAGAVSSGTTLPIAQAPYVVSINDNCTGTLISPTRVLTAGHCLDGSSASDARVVIGADNHLLAEEQRAAFSVPIAGFSVHPGFRELFPFAHKSPVNAIAINDVGIVLLRKPVTTVAPVRLAGGADGALQAPGTSASIIGYGDVVPPAPLSTTPSPSNAAAAASAGSADRSRRRYLRAGLSKGDPGLDAVHDQPGTAGSRRSPRPARATAAARSSRRRQAAPSRSASRSSGPEVMNGACGQLHLPNVSMRVSSFMSFINSHYPVIEPYTVHSGAPGGLRRFAAGASVAGTVQVAHTVICKVAKLGGARATLSYTWALVQNTDRVVARGQKLKITSALYNSAKSPRRLMCTATARNAGGSLKLSSGSRRLLQ